VDGLYNPSLIILGMIYSWVCQLGIPDKLVLFQQDGRRRVALWGIGWNAPLRDLEDEKTLETATVLEIHVPVKLNQFFIAKKRVRHADLLFGISRMGCTY
jgi:hypothetical protein